LSRNRSRTGVEKEVKHADPPVNHLVENSQESGFSFVIPTEFVDLPSRGEFYPTGHPLCGAEHIEIKQMTAKEEDILTSRSLVKKGLAIDRLVNSIIVNKAIDPSTLLVGDRNAILVACRVSGYGNLYTTKVNCPACSTTQKYEFDLNLASLKGPQEHIEEESDTEYDIATNDDGTFDITLPQSKLVVTTRLLNGADERRIGAQMENDRKRKNERTISRQLATMIAAVNGNDTAEAIDYVANNLPSMDSIYLRNAYKYVAPNVDLTQHFSCEVCDHEQDMEVPLNAEFFWPNL